MSAAQVDTHTDTHCISTMLKESSVGCLLETGAESETVLGYSI